jgi:hypothetical protein
MGGKKLLVLALCALSLTLLVGSSASAAILNFTAFLEGAQEVPANASPAKGVGLFTLDDTSGQFDWQIVFFTNLLTSAQTSAHIHGPAAPGVNGPVIIPLAVGSPTVGSQVISPAQQADLKAGLWYVNIHTVTYPGGEIRGQIVPGVPIDVIVPEPSTLAMAVVAAIGMAGLALSLRRRG